MKLLWPRDTAPSWHIIYIWLPTRTHLSLGVIIIDHMTEFKLEPFLRDQEVGPKPQPSNPRACLSGVLSPPCWQCPTTGAHHSHLISINSGVTPKPTMNNKDIPITWEIPGVRKFLPRTQDQDETELYYIMDGKLIKLDFIQLPILIWQIQERNQTETFFLSYNHIKLKIYTIIAYVSPLSNVNNNKYNNNCNLLKI